MYAAVDDETLGHGADLARHIEGAAGGGLGHGGVDVGVGADYHGGVPAQLQTLIFEVPPAVFGHAPPGGGAAREVHPGDALVRGQPFADGLSAAGDALVGIARETGLVHELGEQQHGERVVAGGLGYAAVAAQQRGRDLFCKQRQRRVEGDDADYGADGLAYRDVEVVLHAGLYAEGDDSPREVVPRG